LAKRTGLLPSRIEQALAELAAQGWVTSDSFEGLRALLVPPEKRAPFAQAKHRRHHKAVTSLEFAGRWSLLRTVPKGSPDFPSVVEKAPEASSAPTLTASRSAEPKQNSADAAIEIFAHALLQRYGVVFRRLLERECLNVSWYDLGRVLRRLEARGEIRGGYFVSGVSGEQFALPEGIGLLRSLRKHPGDGQLVVVSAADPLNLAGILSPGPRVSAIAANRLMLRDGVPLAALEAGQFTRLDPQAPEPEPALEPALRVGALPPALRPYYA